jgi:enoyl-CoA hydratase
MLACDARIAAATDAKLGLTEVTAGIPYPACPMEVVRAELAPADRRVLVMTGAIITPAHALAHGIVDALVSEEALVDRAVELAKAHAAYRSYARVKDQLRALGVIGSPSRESRRP